MGLFFQPLNYNVHTMGVKVEATAPHPLRETEVREVLSPISEKALSATHLCPRAAVSAPALLPASPQMSRCQSKPLQGNHCRQEAREPVPAAERQGGWEVGKG